MQATVDPLSGNISVTLGGAVVLCAKDADCPGGALCAVMPKWPSAFPAGMCTCPSALIQGATCAETNPAFVVVHVFNLGVPLLVAFICLVLGLRALSVLFFKGNGQIKLNARSLTIVYATLASVFILIECALGVVELTNPTAGVSVVVSSGAKVYPVAIVGALFILPTFFFITLGALNVSLVWIDVAQATRQLKHMPQKRAQTWKTFLSIYFVVFFICIVILVVVQQVILDILFLLSFAFVALCYVFGLWALRDELLSTLDQGTSMSARLRAAVKLMEQTAAGVSILCAIIAVCLIALIGLNVGGPFETPLASPKSIVNLFINDAVVLLNLVVMRYCHQTLQGRVNSSSVTSGQTVVNSVAVSTPATP